MADQARLLLTTVQFKAHRFAARSGVDRDQAAAFGIEGRGLGGRHPRGLAFDDNLVELSREPASSRRMRSSR